MRKEEKLLFIFIVIQPFLDYYLFFSDKIKNIFKFSPSTIIRIIFILGFLLYILIKNRKEKISTNFKVYFVLLILYMIFHFINSLKFNQSILSTMSFSFVTEFFYFIRLMIPLLLIYIVYKTKVSENTFKKTILAVSLIFSLEIIITNLFKISLRSYGDENTILGNILDWFSNSSYTFEELASKGLFYMANPISAVLISILPVSVYYYMRFSNKVAYLSSLFLSIALIMLGTRVGTYGWILVFVCMFIGWIIFCAYTKEINKKIFKRVLIFLCTFIFLIFLTTNSPLARREKFSDYEKLENSLKNRNKIIDELNKLETKTEKVNFILNKSKYFSVPDIYIRELYPAEDTYEFWIDVYKLPYSERGGNRNLEKLITEDIYSKSNNKSDKFFGMGYSRFRNAKIYIENDFLVHFYTIGIFGIFLFISPYFIITTYSVIYMLKNNRLRFKICMLCVCVYACLGISYFSGHALDEFIVTIILAFICGYLLVFVKHDKEKYLMNKINIKEKTNEINLSIIVPAYNCEKYIYKCMDSLINQTFTNYEIIVIDDGSTDNTSSILDNYSLNNKKIQIVHIKNGGVANARNTGLSLAKGKYIGFVDSDDIIESTMYEKLYNKAIKNNLDIVACDVNMVYPNKMKIISSGIFDSINNDVEKKQMIINSYAVIWNKIYKKDILKGINFKDKSNFCEDVEFLFRVLPISNSFGNIDEPLYKYIQHEGSLTYVYDDKLYQLIDNFDGLVELYSKGKKYTNYLEELEYSYVRYLYATFIKRLAKTKDYDKFSNGVDIVLKKVNTKFPNYKKNKYIRNIKIKNFYLRFFNKKIANIVFKFEKNKMN